MYDSQTRNRLHEIIQIYVLVSPRCKQIFTVSWTAQDEYYMTTHEKREKREKRGREELRWQKTD
jgi:hypothetical protein